MFLRKVQTPNRNSIIGEKYRWPPTVPYYLEDSLGTTTISRLSVVVVDTNVFAVGCLICRNEGEGGDPASV